MVNPEEVSGVNEAFPVDAPTMKPLYLVLIVILGLVLVIGVVAWVILAFAGIAMPEGLAVIVGAVSGGLVGVLTGPTTGGRR